MTKAVLQKKFVIMYEWNNDLLNNLVIEVGTFFSYDYDWVYNSIAIQAKI